MVLVKVHATYRKIIAVCDKELLGKKFEQGNLQLEVNNQFYGGEDFDDKKTVSFLKDAMREDACFNFVGSKSIDLGVKAGVIDKEHVLVIRGIPHALALL